MKKKMSDSVSIKIYEKMLLLIELIAISSSGFRRISVASMEYSILAVFIVAGHCLKGVSFSVVSSLALMAQFYFRVTADQEVILEVAIHVFQEAVTQTTGIAIQA